jgi:thiol-disulfide isomerase/thioredoxin
MAKKKAPQADSNVEPTRPRVDVSAVPAQDVAAPVTGHTESAQDDALADMVPVGSKQRGAAPAEAASAPPPAERAAAPETVAAEAMDDGAGPDDVIKKSVPWSVDTAAVMASTKAWIVPGWLKGVFFWGSIAMVAGLVTHKVVERIRYAEILVDTIMDPVPVSGAAYEFALSDGEGGPPVDLKDLRGRYVFVNFWATWCPPCREEMPSMEFMARKFGKDMAVLAVSVDEDWNEVKKFFGAEPPTFRVLWDPKRVSSRRYGTDKFPESYLINPEGRVVAKFIGPRDWNNQASEEYFRRLVQKGGS